MEPPPQGGHAARRLRSPSVTRPSASREELRMVDVKLGKKAARQDSRTLAYATYRTAAEAAPTDAHWGHGLPGDGDAELQDQPDPAAVAEQVGQARECQPQLALRRQRLEHHEPEI